MTKIKVIPCSGIGKVYGLMAREAALHITNTLDPENTETVCLAHIVTGEEDALEKVSNCDCVTIDGCPKLCALKSVEEAGGKIIGKFRSIDEMKNHRGKNPGTASKLSDDGWKITEELAEKISSEIKGGSDNEE